MSNYLLSPADALQLVEEGLHQLELPTYPPGLYEPIHYFLSLGGKRIRPCLTLLSSNVFSDNPSAYLKPALAIELFHNFTLVHDDVMDKAPLRRGSVTVHEKWNLNTAILSGDLILIEAYRLLSEAPSAVLHNVLSLFHQTAREVCEGQQLDMDFEQREQVSQEEYLEMIRLKTSVLLGCALSIGALCGGATHQQAQLLYKFGEELGITFQIMDDLLDAFPQDGQFGKKAGGDIENNKKTFLYIRAMEVATPRQAASLQAWQQSDETDRATKVLDLMRSLDVPAYTRAAMETHYQNALRHLHILEKEGLNILVLQQLAKAIYERTY